MNISELKQYLKEPYPYFYDLRNVIHISVLVFVLTLFFNYFFEPFEINQKEHKLDFFWISALHAFVSFFVIFISSILFLFFRRSADGWTIKKEFGFIFITLVLIGIGQFLIRDIIYNNPNNWSWGYFFEEIKNTVLVGTFFLAIVIPIIHYRFLKQNQKKLKQFKPFKTLPITSSEGNVLIQTLVKTDDFNLDPAQLLYALSDGNYTEVNFLQGDKVKRKLIRIPLKRLEMQLTPFTYIHRTHRSYLVNLLHVHDIEGNAQGFKLKVHRDLANALVSRKMVDDFRNKMELLRN